MVYYEYMKKISTFSERLKILMDLNSINANALSLKLNINKSIISRYLSGKMQPKQDRLDAIANFFKVNHAWLMGYDCEMFKQSETKELILESIKSIDNEEILMRIYLFIKNLNEE